MSIASHAGRLRRIAGARGTQIGDWMAAVYEVDRQYRAKQALDRSAQEPGGVAPPMAETAPAHETPSSQLASAAAKPISPARPVWGPDNRPGVHDVLTWEEVMRLPWIEGEESILVRSP